MSYAQIYTKLYHLLNKQEKRNARWLLVLMLATALVEVGGVASIMPFVALLSDPGVVQTNTYLAKAYAISGLQSPQHFLAAVGVVVFILFFLTLALKALSTYAMLQFTNLQSHAFSFRLLCEFMQKPYEFYLQRNTADLSKTLFSEVGEVTSGVLMPALRLLSGGVVVALLLGFLLVVSWPMTIAAAVMMGGGFGLAYFFIKTYLQKNGKKRLKYNKQRFITANESLNGYKELSLMGRQSFYLNKFEKASSHFAKLQAVSKAMGDLPTYAVQGLAFGVVVAILVYATIFGEGLKDMVPLLALYAFAGYRLLPAIQVIFKNVTQLRFYSAALDSLVREMGDTAQQGQPQVAVSEPVHQRLFGDISIQSLTYRYPDTEAPSVNAVSLTIPQGSFVAFVGSSGAGKSTLVDLLLGLLKPASGQITVDGLDLSQADHLQRWQQNIGYVPQSIYLCDGTVAENIAFGVEPSQIDMDAVRSAAAAANISQFVEEQLPSGYQTHVGERGVRLSGGQRQRLGIARALYHNPQVIVFDEATSALDNVTEASVMSAIAGLAKDKTIILIAHRMTTVKDCHIIYFMQSGKLLAAGNYPHLVQHSPEFFDLVNASNKSSESELVA